MSMHHGIDLSGSQKPARCDYREARRAGVEFAGVKLTEGSAGKGRKARRGYVSPYALDHARGLADAGIPFFYYHYALPSPEVCDADLEVSHFCATMNAFPAAQLRPACDLEESALPQAGTGGEDFALTAWASTFLAALPAALIYGGRFLRHLAAGMGLERRDVWLSRYPSGAPRDFDDAPTKMPAILGPWGQRRPLVWQWSSAGRVAGIDGNVDLNLCADLAALRAVP